MTELKPCRECNCTGVAETIGGYDRPCDACSGMGEIRTRAAPRTDGEDGDHARGCEGRNYTCTCGHDDRLAARITALSAEVERLTEAYNRLGDMALANVGRLASESGRKDVEIDALAADLQALRRQALGAKG